MPSYRCKRCSADFDVDSDDIAFLDRLAPRLNGQTYRLPPPRLCPPCRAQRRLQWRNERNFYHRSCAATGKRLLSVYPEESGIAVYDYDTWWTERFDPLQWGRPYDPSQSFFEQFGALLRAVPLMALIGSQNENCPYCHLLANCKNCYLVIESSNNEDCMYGYWLQKCLGCCEVSYSHECGYCFEVDNCYNCYSLAWSKDCTNCTDSMFLENCVGCRRCFCCVNLAQREYCVMNEQLSKSDYERFIDRQKPGGFSAVSSWLTKFDAFAARFPKKYAHILRSEDCSGDYIMTSRDCRECFHAHDAEHCKYGEHVWRNSKNNRDVSTAGRDAEFIYEAINAAVSSYNVKFAVQCWTCSDLSYCYGCFNSSDSFGCVGLKKHKYCLLNRQYSKDDYEKLLGTVLNEMTAAGEWGEFFPERISPFCYNETAAQEQFPLTEEEAAKQGIRWRAKNPRDYEQQTAILPDSVAEASDSIVRETLSCGRCARNYRIISQELKYHREQAKPLPRFCPDCRHGRRMRARNPNRTWLRKCSVCGLSVTSAYAPSRAETILCETCFAREVF